MLLQNFGKIWIQERVIYNSGTCVSLLEIFEDFYTDALYISDMLNINWESTLEKYYFPKFFSELEIFVNLLSKEKNTNCSPPGKNLFSLRKIEFF